MIVFAVEALHPDLIPIELLRAHYEENAPMKRTFKQALDWSHYLAAQEKGDFVLVTARMDGKMVGYMAIFLQAHPHYMATTVALDDAHYLEPGCRGMGHGKKMIAFAEAVAAARGASVFSMRCKAAQPHGHIFEALGYKLTDLVYLKELNHED
jgi:GNAT superfamily N-acetyltransferase